MTESSTKRLWPGFNYQQVPGLANRHISRYLRSQRKTMRRFFLGRGFLDLAERLQQIKRSRQGMLAKNRMFQKVLDDYTNRLQPSIPSALGAAAAPTAEATHSESANGGYAVSVPADGGVDVPAGSDVGLADAGDRARGDADAGVPGLEVRDDSTSEIVIEE